VSADDTADAAEHDVAGEPHVDQVAREAAGTVTRDSERALAMLRGIGTSARPFSTALAEMSARPFSAALAGRGLPKLARTDNWTLPPAPLGR